MTIFEDRVYEQIREGTQRSARVVAPRLVEEHRRSRGVAQPVEGLQVLDVGCGEGWWSAALAAQPEVKEVISIDQAVPEVFAPGVTVQVLDLERGDGVELVGKPFDIVVCLETAEHLKPTAAVGLVAMLCAVVAPTGIIVWSAAVPGQGGHGHWNEQWPAYWDHLFRAQGWRLSDPLRDMLWDHPDVEPWYAQNLLIGVTPSANGTSWAAGGSPRRLVHPTIFEARLADVAFWREDALKWKRRAERHGS